MKRKIILFCLNLFFLTLFTDAAYSGIEVPGRTRWWVNDYAGIIDEETKGYLEGLISSIEQKTPDPIEIIVATFKSLEGWRVEDFEREYGERWRLSKTGRDNGVVVLITLEERRIDIGVGQNLKNILTDPKIRNIIDNIIAPEFNKLNFSLGIKKGVEAIMEILKDRDIPRDTPFTVITNSFKVLLAAFVIFILFIIGSRRSN